MRRYFGIACAAILAGTLLCSCGRTLNIGGDEPEPAVEDGGLVLSMRCETSPAWEEGSSAGQVILSMEEGDRDRDCEIICKVDGETFVEEAVVFASYIGDVTRKLPVLGEGAHTVTLSAKQGGSSFASEVRFDLVRTKRPVQSVKLTVKDSSNGREYSSTLKDGAGASATGLDVKVGDKLSFAAAFSPDDAECSGIDLSVRSGNAVGQIKSDGKGGWTGVAEHAGEAVLALTYRDCDGSHTVSVTVEVCGSLAFRLDWDESKGAVMVDPWSLGDDDAEYGWTAEYVIHAVSVTHSSVMDQGTAHYRDFTENWEGTKMVHDGPSPVIYLSDIIDEMRSSYEVANYTHMGKTWEMRCPYMIESIDFTIEFLADKKRYDCTCEPWESLPYEDYTEWTITINDKR